VATRAALLDLDLDVLIVANVSHKGVAHARRYQHKLFGLNPAGWRLLEAAVYPARTTRHRRRQHSLVIDGRAFNLNDISPSPVLQIGAASITGTRPADERHRIRREQAVDQRPARGA